MPFGHEKLDVYRLAIGYVAWVYGKASDLMGIHRPAGDQWLRASQSIPLNIAEGNGKAAEADRRRYFETARGSALECASIQDVLVVGGALGEEESRGRKADLDRMAAMLSRLGGRGYRVGESAEEYVVVGIESHRQPYRYRYRYRDRYRDSDVDTDTDTDGEQQHTEAT